MPLMHKIDRFQNQYYFLSNFSASPIYYMGQIFQTVEHAYQAGKAINADEMKFVMDAPTPREAKRRGRSVQKRHDWETIKYAVMEMLVTIKFANDPFQTKLIETFPMLLEEGNDWGDREWGTVGGIGANHLGRILMNVRGKLIHGN